MSACVGPKLHSLADPPDHFTQFLLHGVVTTNPPPTVSRLRFSTDFPVIDTNQLPVRHMLFSIFNEDWGLAYANLMELRRHTRKTVVKSSGSRLDDGMEAGRIVAFSIIQLMGKELYVSGKGANSYTKDHGHWLNKDNATHLLLFVQEVGTVHGESSAHTCIQQYTDSTAARYHNVLIRPPPPSSTLVAHDKTWNDDPQPQTRNTA